jgi:hypothetical protein
MRQVMTFTASAALALAAGCAAEAPSKLAVMNSVMASTGLIEDAGQREALERSLTDEDIARMLDADVQAKLPTSLAVARVYRSYNGPCLAEFDDGELAGWEEAADGLAAIRDVRPVSSLALPAEEPATLRALRAAAARQGCELLWVYVQGDSAVSNANDASVLYLTGVGLLLAPGTTIEHKTVIQGALVDARTGMILGTDTGSEQMAEDVPAAFADHHRQMQSERAAEAAMKELRERFARTLRRVAG